MQQNLKQLQQLSESNRVGLLLDT